MITPQNTFHYAYSHEFATLYVKRSRRPRCSFLYGGQGSRSAAVLLLLIMFSTLGCDVIGVFKDNSTRPIDHELVFLLAEQHEIAPEAPDVPKLFFTMRTKKNFGCSGYRIRHEVERTNDQVVVRVLGIKGPDGPSRLQRFIGAIHVTPLRTIAVRRRRQRLSVPILRPGFRTCRSRASRFRRKAYGRTASKAKDTNSTLLPSFTDIPTRQRGRR